MNSLHLEQLHFFHFKGQAPQDIPQEIQELFTSFSKQETYYASRQALKNALEELGISVKSFAELEIENHHHLKKFPKFLVSLSHSRNFAVAFIASQNCYQSIGVDIELRQRKMQPNVLKFFINSDDEYLDPLELWVQKEAAFKAISPMIATPNLTLKMITIKKQSFSLSIKKEFTGTVSLEKIIYKNEEFLLAKAFLPYPT